MSPVTNKAASNLEVGTNKTIHVNDDEADEGFVSPSVQRIGLLRNRNKECETNGSSSSSSDNDSQPDSSHEGSDGGGGDRGGSQPPQSSSSDDDELELVNQEKKDEKETKETQKKTTTEEAATNKVTVVNKDVAESKAENLANFIVNTLLGKDNGNTSDKVERTLLRCVKMMMQKHEILFKGMMRRLQVTRETGYISFVTVANTLFEEDKKVVTWSRIVALYAFGGQLAMYCKENNMEDFANTVAGFMGKYAKEVLTPHITSNLGGWEKMCDEFPDEGDMENTIRRVLSWTAVGLGVAATVSYLTSR